MVSFVNLAAATAPADVIAGATTTLLPQLLTVGGAAIVVSAGLLVLRRGWGFFRGMAR
jgi:hypothetical protein